MEAEGYENPYNSRESPYLHLIFTQHTLWPLIKESKNIDGPIPNDASKFVAPLPLSQKLKVPKTPQKHKKSGFRNFF